MQSRVNIYLALCWRTNERIGIKQAASHVMRVVSLRLTKTSMREGKRLVEKG